MAPFSRLLALLGLIYYVISHPPSHQKVEGLIRKNGVRSALIYVTESADKERLSRVRSHNITMLIKIRRPTNK